VKRIARAPQVLVKLIAASSVFMVFAFTVRLATGLVIGDRAIVLNVFICIGSGLLWLSVTKFVYKYLKTLLSNQKQAASLLPTAELVFIFCMGSCGLTEVLIFLIPSLSPKLNFFPVYHIANLIRGGVLSLAFSFFAFRALHLMSAQSSKSVEQTLRRRIDLILMLSMTVGILATIMVCLMVTIDTLVRNQYIVYGIVTLAFQGIHLGILLWTREDDDDSSGPKIVEKTTHSGYFAGKPQLQDGTTSTFTLDSSTSINIKPSQRSSPDSTLS